MVTVIRAAITFLMGALAAPRLAEAQQPEETVKVNATGVGATAAEAEKQAVLGAVQQAVGMFIDSETLVKNEQIVHDKVLSVSNGFVSTGKGVFV